MFMLCHMTHPLAGMPIRAMRFLSHRMQSIRVGCCGWRAVSLAVSLAVRQIQENNLKRGAKAGRF